MPTATRMLTVSAAVALMLLVGSPAQADPQTGRLRDIDCGPAGTLTVELGPAEFLTTTSAAIHVVGSTDVLVPRRVEVLFPDGTQLVTLDKATSNVGQKDLLTCTYTDPAGLFVTVVAART